MKKDDLDQLRNQLSVESKNGVDFTIAATIIWALIAFIWTLNYDSYTKSILVFIMGTPLLPLAFALSRILKIKWKIQDNPLQSLGLWLNFAQLFYFPFLIFVLIRRPDYFLMTYAIITGAHLFPYSWFYKTKWYAILAGIISLGSLLLNFTIKTENHFYIGVLTSVCMCILSVGLITDFNNKRKKYREN